MTKRRWRPFVLLLVRGHTVAIETVFDDYREVGGVLFPHAIETGAVSRPQRL
jgi:hypothetical protein